MWSSRPWKPRHAEQRSFLFAGSGGSQLPRPYFRPGEFPMQNLHFHEERRPLPFPLHRRLALLRRLRLSSYALTDGFNSPRPNPWRIPLSSTLLAGRINKEDVRIIELVSYNYANYEISYYYAGKILVRQLKAWPC